MTMKKETTADASIFWAAAYPAHAFLSGGAPRTMCGRPIVHSRWTTPDFSAMCPDCVRVLANARHGGELPGAMLFGWDHIVSSLPAGHEWKLRRVRRHPMFARLACDTCGIARIILTPQESYVTPSGAFYFRSCDVPPHARRFPLLREWLELRHPEALPALDRLEA